jgi:hypothetical protein
MATAKKKRPTVFAPTTPEGKIHFTRDYDKFKRLAGNRAIRPHHVHEIKTKMLEHDLRVPILVNKQMQIIDGQHTLEARRELKLDVPYRIGEKLSLMDVQTLNSTSLAWSNDDYANSFIELGNRHYKTYRTFRNKYDLPHEVAMILLAGRGADHMRKAFRTGDFVVGDLPDAEAKAQMLNELKQFTRGFRLDTFVRAFVIALNREGFQFSKFLERARENVSLFSYWPKVDQNLRMIEDIYNKGYGKKVPLLYAQNIRESKPEKKSKGGNGRVNGKASSLHP